MAFKMIRNLINYFIKRRKEKQSKKEFNDNLLFAAKFGSEKSLKIIRKIVKEEEKNK